jgi:thymidine kinase
MKTGSIEVIVGGMYSGKTEELLRRVKRFRYAKKNVMVVKPKIDNRYSESEVVSHSGIFVDSVIISDISDLNVDSSVDVVAIDEAQFFGSDLISVCTELANNGKVVIIAGLDMDFNGKPFQPMPEMMAIAESVDKLHAVCTECGEKATFSYLKENETDGSNIKVGGKEKYEARCRKCYNNALLVDK